MPWRSRRRPTTRKACSENNRRALNVTQHMRSPGYPGLFYLHSSEVIEASIDTAKINFSMRQENIRERGTAMSKVVNAVLTLWVSLLVLCTVAFAVPRLFEITPYAIASASMQPSFPVGSVVYSKSASILDLMEGDVIVFSFPSSDLPIVHRVVSVDVLNDEIETKGDANDVSDPQRVPAENIEGKVVFSLPSIGYVQLAFMREPLAFALIIASISFILCISCNRQRKSRSDDASKPT